MKGDPILVLVSVRPADLPDDMSEPAFASLLFGTFCSVAEFVLHSLRIYADYVDLYLIHSPLAGKDKRLETYASLLKKRDEGRIRTVGVSN